MATVVTVVAIGLVSAIAGVFSVRHGIHRHMRRRAEPYRPRQGTDFATSEERGGIRRVQLAGGPVVAAAVGARLRDVGVPHQIDVTDGGGEPNASAAHVLLFQAADEGLVVDVLDDVDGTDQR